MRGKGQEILLLEWGMSRGETEQMNSLKQKKPLNTDIPSADVSSDTESPTEYIVEILIYNGLLHIYNPEHDNRCFTYE